MDRDRLKEVHQTDLTESRVNEDFVDWLKSSGPTYLLVLLLGITGFLGWNKWKDSQRTQANEAWVALSDAALPRSKEDVAVEHAKIFAVPQLALRYGGVQLLGAVQSGTPIDQSDTTTATPGGASLTNEDREHYLTRADEMFRRIVDGDDKLQGDDGSLALTLHVVNALNGRAAIAESRGDLETARQMYEAAATRAEPFYPQLSVLARSRAETVSEYAVPVVLTTVTNLTPTIEPPPLRQPTVQSYLRDLLFNDPDDDAGDEG
jgi:hypothetical protein